MTCLSFAGYMAGETIRAGAVQAIAIARTIEMTAIAVDNARRAIENFRKQYKIAKRGLQIAKEQQAHLENNFWPKELLFLDEFANGKYRDGVEVEETVEVLGRRYGGRLVSAVANKFAKQLRMLRCDMPRYNTSANRKALQDLLLIRSQAIASARVLGRNIAFMEVQMREDRDWNYRMQATSLGKGLMAEAMNLIASAAQNLSSTGAAAMAGLSSALGEAGNSFQQMRSARAALNGGITMQAAQMNFGSGSGATYQHSFTGVSAAPGGNPFGVNAAYGFAGTTGSMSSFFPSSTFGTPSNPNTYMSSLGASNDFAGSWAFRPGQMDYNSHYAEHWQNAGEIGYQDKVRAGIVTYPVVGVTGGSVTINMADFPLMYSDGYPESPVPMGVPYSFAYPPIPPFG